MGMWSNNQHSGKLVSVPSCDSAIRKGEPSWDTASSHCTNIGPGEIFISGSPLDKSSVSLPHGPNVISVAEFRGFGQDHRECAITTDGRNKKRNNPLQFCTSIIDYSANPNKILREVLKQWIEIWSLSIQCRCQPPRVTSFELPMVRQLCQKSLATCKIQPKETSFSGSIYIIWTVIGTPECVVCCCGRMSTVVKAKLWTWETIDHRRRGSWVTGHHQSSVIIDKFLKNYIACFVAVVPLFLLGKQRSDDRLNFSVKLCNCVDHVNKGISYFRVLVPLCVID